MLYTVGPGLKYINLRDLPWASIHSGDTVQVIGRSGAAYFEKPFLWQSDFLLEGFPGTDGKKPILDGTNARECFAAPIAFRHPNGDRALVYAGNERQFKYGQKPQNVTIKGFEIRNAYCGDPAKPNTYIDSLGVVKPWAVNAAGVYSPIVNGLNILNCDIHDCNNGVEVSSLCDPEITSRILLDGCYIYGNGTSIPSSIRTLDRDHNVYLEADGEEVRYCKIGPLRKGAGGSAYKTRSSGVFFHHNDVSEGAHLLDLVEPEGSGKCLPMNANYQDTRIEDNIFRGTNVVYPFHLGGDKGMGQHRPNIHFKRNKSFFTADKATVYRMVLYKNDTPTNLYLEDEEVTVISNSTRSNVYLIRQEYPAGAQGSVNFVTPYKFYSVVRLPAVVSVKISPSVGYDGKVSGFSLIQTLPPTGQTPSVIVPPVVTAPPPVPAPTPVPTPSGKLLAPTMLVASVVGRVVSLTWLNNDPTATQWRVYRDNVSIASSSKVMSSYTDAPPSGVHIYKVQARRKDITGEVTVFSSSVTVTVP